MIRERGKIDKSYDFDFLKKSALITGLKLFGLPNPRFARNHSSRACFQDMERFGINSEDYKGIQEKHGEMSSGLIWGKYEIKRETTTERIKELTQEALENFLYIGTYEFVFYPYSPDKPLKDFSDTFSLFDPELQDLDGNIYTCCGECNQIFIISVDTDLYGAVGIYLDIAKSLQKSGHYSQSNMADILIPILMEYGEDDWELKRI